ncbi:MAG TPA: dicarboxylate/amino acid:cation symporter, partial [Leptospiraceae bacterium]|nr:dicarboxylate/amino acid:cation symporter [Leptospiraceae bacterium]
KVVAIPLVFISLVAGITSLRDTSKVKRIGLRTIIIYLFTTVVAVCLGLSLVNITKPGHAFPESKRKELQESFKKEADKKRDAAKDVQDSPPLQALVDMFPVNIFKAASENTQMLQVIVFAFLFGIAMVMIPGDRANLVRPFFEGMNDIILKMIDIIMQLCPYGVFALLASLLVEFAGGDITKTWDLFQALGLYSLTVLVGLFIMVYVNYGLLLKILTKRSPGNFFRSIFPVQMLAFSTSSSSATLPLTMEHCEKELGVSNEVASFVLPVGATVNMDGTSLYQAVAAVFIAQAMGMNLDFAAQLKIVLTATLASIGAAGVPGAGMVMLVIVLNSVNVPVEGISLIFAVDRLLDMFRTTVNVTGDMVVAVAIQEHEDKRKDFFES